MKFFAKIASLLLLCVVLIPAVFAIELQEAKSQGLVGEKNDGFLGAVQANANAEVAQLIEEVNTERSRRYQQIAVEQGITPAQVAAIFYERAVQETRPGHYVQNANGAWQQK